MQSPRLPARLIIGLSIIAAACTSPARTGTDQADSRIFTYEEVPFDLVETPGATKVGVYDTLDVVFGSPSGGRVTGRLHIPADVVEEAAAVILLHGSGGNARDMDGLAEMFACGGIIAIAVDAPSAGRGDAFVSFTHEDYEDQIRLVTDLRRTIDLLLDSYGASTDRLGLYGVSYGAAMGSLLLGVEPRIDAAALMVGDGGLVAHFTQDGRPIEVVANVPNIQAWIEEMSEIEPSRYLAASGDTPVLMVSATRDESVPVEDAEAWHASAGPGAQVRWVDGGHRLDEAAWTDAVHWLGNELGEPADRLSECTGP